MRKVPQPYDHVVWANDIVVVATSIQTLIDMVEASRPAVAAEKLGICGEKARVWGVSRAFAINIQGTHVEL